MKMYYEGDKSEIEWRGKTEVVNGQCVVLCENDKGVFQGLFLATGALVPENWIGQKVKITVEKL